MKKGYLINQHPELIPANYDLIYILGMRGIERDPLYMQKWNSISPLKRGLIHQPVLAVNADEYDNASAFLGLLNDLGYSNWNNDVPLIVDIWQAKDAAQFNLDHIRVYGQYITDNFQPKVKPLLRLNVITWNNYIATNRTEALRLLSNWEILLFQPGVTKPATLMDYGVPVYWEHTLGLYKVDETRQWTISEPPVIVPPIDEPDPISESPVIVSPIPRKWKISLFGGLIKGTLESDE